MRYYAEDTLLKEITIAEFSNTQSRCGDSPERSQTPIKVRVVTGVDELKSLLFYYNANSLNALVIGQRIRKMQEDSPQWF